MPEPQTAIDIQIGGDHYKKYRLQPIQFADENWWPASLAYALKHITRHQDKLGRQDLEKAKHYIQLRAEVGAPPLPHPPKYSMAECIEMNGIPAREATILMSIESWYHQRCRPDHAGILKQLDDAIAHYYPN